MSSYPFKCDLCGGVTDAPTYGDFKCQHCGQAYVYDECHQIKLSEPQLKTLRDSRWIPVSERLPEEDDYVLACYEGGFVRIAKLTPEEDDMIQCWHLDGGNDVTIKAFTHWMPLPKPPEVK